MVFIRRVGKIYGCTPPQNQGPGVRGPRPPPERCEGGDRVRGGADEGLRPLPVQPRRRVRRAGRDPRRDPGRRAGGPGGARHPGTDRREVLLEAALHRGPPGPRPRPEDERGGADLELPPVAARVLRAVLRGRVLARVPEDRLPPVDPVVPAAAAAVWSVRPTTHLSNYDTPGGVVNST